MIKIQARMVVIPHTMTVCLTYSMQAPGLFVPGLRACKEQGLFTFSTGLRKQAAFAFMLHSREQLWTGCTSSSPQHLKASCLSFFLVCLSYTLSFSLFSSRCISVPEAGCTFRKQQKVKQVCMSRRAAVFCSRNFFFFCFNK